MEAKQIEQMLDDEFLERLLKATTDEEIKILLKEKGLEFSDKQIDDLKEKFVNNLKDEMLSTVSGGKNIKGAALEGAWHGAVWGGVAGGALAGLIIGIVDAEKNKDKYKTVPMRALVCLRDTVVTMATVGAVSSAVGAGIGASASALWGDK